MQKQAKIRTYIIFAVFGIALGAGYIFYPKVLTFVQRIEEDKKNEDVMAEIIENNVLETTIENIQNVINESDEEVKEPEVNILENAYLNVPFVCQAPFQTTENWKFHEESCEEAALLQVKYYLDGVKEADPQTANDMILDMIEWQKKNFGEHKDLYANDMKLFIRDYYNIPEDRIVVVYDAEITDIKKIISQGYPVIAPIMGDILNNPYYPYPGYHMLTVIGYTPDNIITNDVGTKRGKDYTYSYDIFMKALKAAGGDIIYIKNN